MESPIKTVRISQTGAERLNQLKRVTKIPHMNTLCRWALCYSLAESSIPSPVKLESDSKIEIAWDTFGGENADLLLAALKVRCHRDGLPGDEETLKTQFSLHLHRGLAYLAEQEELTDIEQLVKLAV